MEWLVGILSNITGRPVVDKTGLTGYYDWVLEWTPDAVGATPAAPAQPVAGASEERSAPPITTALREQLGLRLEVGKGPVELVVIDEVRRPSAN